MLSYQWNSQEKVKRIADALTARGVRVWLDINGDMSGNINVAMAEVSEVAALRWQREHEFYRLCVCALSIM